MFINRARIGPVLLLLGLIALIVGFVKFESREEVFRVGDFRATTTHERTIPAVRYAGVGLMLTGGVLIAIRFRRPESR